jgi:glycosyltransferase involved in cell wall biosynthesis
MGSFMEGDRVSVVIPCFNNKQTLGHTLASVAAQTKPASEVIVVDDGSTDGSWELLHQLRQSSYPHLKILCHEEHQNYGASLTRSLGVAHAQGDYIALLDADDLFAPEKLERQLEAFARHPNLVLCHTAVRVFVDLEKAAYFKSAFSGSPTSPYRYRSQRDYLIRNRICNSSVLVKAGQFRDLPCSFVGKDSVEDWLCWCLLAARGEYLYLDQPLTLYHVHSASKTAALTHGGSASVAIATQSANKLRQLYVNLEFKLVLLARSESSLHALRVLGSIGEDLRRIVLAYLWNPGCDPNSARTIRPNLLIRMLMVPFAIARRFAAWFDAPAFRR